MPKLARRTWAHIAEEQSRLAKARRESLRRQIAIGLLLFASLAIPHTAHAHESYGPILIPNDQDFVWHFRSDNAIGASTNVITLREFKDVNNDGVLEENDLILTQPASADCSDDDLDPHFACATALAVNGNQAIVWKNASSFHNVGNFSILFIMRDAVAATITQITIGIRIVPAAALASDVASARENLRNQANAIEANETARLNTHGANMSTFEENHDTNISDMLQRQDDNNTRGASRFLPVFEDTVFTFDNPSVTPTTFDFRITALKDLNGDMVYSGGSEVDNIIDLVGVTTCATATTLVCRVDMAQPLIDITWLSNATNHNIGNYSMRFRWNGPSGLLYQETMGFRLGSSGGNTSVSQTIINTGGTTDPRDVIFSRYVILAAIYLVFVFATIQGGYGMAFGGSTLAIFTMLFLFGNMGFLGTDINTILAGFLFIFPVVMGINNMRADYMANRMMREETGERLT